MDTIKFASSLDDIRNINQQFFNIVRDAFIQKIPAGEQISGMAAGASAVHRRKPQLGRCGAVPSNRCVSADVISLAVRRPKAIWNQ